MKFQRSCVYDTNVTDFGTRYIHRTTMFWQWFAACSSGTRSTTRLNRRWHVRDRKTRRHPRTIRNKLSEERGRTFEPNYRSFRPLQTKCSTALTALAVHQGDKQTRRLSLASLPSFSDAFSFFLQWTTILFPRTNANCRALLSEISVFLAPRRSLYGLISLSLLCLLHSTIVYLSYFPSLYFAAPFNVQCCRHTSFPLSHRIAFCHLAFLIFWNFINALLQLNDVSWQKAFVLFKELTVTRKKGKWNVFKLDPWRDNAMHDMFWATDVRYWFANNIDVTGATYCYQLQHNFV